MSKLYEKQELLLKDRFNRVGLRQLERLHGVKVKLYRSEKNVFSNIYGVESGDEDTAPIQDLTVLITGDGFTPMDSFNAGLLTEGWLFSSKINLVRSGDLIEMQRPDGRAYKFKIMEQDSLGMTTVVVIRYKIVAIGEGNLK